MRRAREAMLDGANPPAPGGMDGLDSAHCHPHPSVIPNVSQLPPAMRGAKRWLVHKNKVPFYPNGKPRSGELDGATDCQNLGTLDDALAALPTGRFDGLGFALGFDGNGYWQGIDLDKVEANGLQGLANALPGYREYSPSGQGCHAIGFGCKFSAIKLNGIEAYSEGRYFTVTANSIGGDLADLEPYVTAQFEPMRRRTAAAAPRVGRSHESDASALSKLLSNQMGVSLYYGDLSAYGGNYSCAEQAMVNMLALVSGDPDQVERLWLGSPLGQRHKTQSRPAYRQRTIDTAFATRPAALPIIDLNGVTCNGQPLPHGVIEQAHQPWISAAVLKQKHFDPTEWVVPGILPQGAIILGGRPKLGKSWAALDIAIAVADGSVAFGKQCSAGNVLYGALEDTLRRLKSRMWKLTGPSAWPTRLDFLCELPRADEGGIEIVRSWLVQAEMPRLVIVDTLAKVRPGKGRDEGNYDADYRAVTCWKELADEFNVAIVLVHHVRKMVADDPIEMISGTNGLTGAADAILILNRTGQGSTLGGRGRDLEDFALAIHFDSQDCRWSVLGDAADVQRSNERNAILGVLARSPVPLAPKQIAATLGAKDDAVRQMVLRMTEAGEITKVGRGLYATPSHGSHRDPSL